MQVDKANMKDSILYIGESVYDKLSEEDQKQFKLFEYYKPDYLNENIQYMQENDESGEWYDECFEDLEDYEEFIGMDWDSCRVNVYKRRYKVFTGEEEKKYRDLADKEEGNPIRIKEVDEDYVEEDEDYDVDWEV